MNNTNFLREIMFARQQKDLLVKVLGLFYLDIRNNKNLRNYINNVI